MAKKSQPQFKRASKTLYLATEEELNKIDSMISILGLAVGEVLRARLIRDPPEKETPHEDDFNSQVQLALDDADRQMDLPWRRDDF